MKPRIVVLVLTCFWALALVYGSLVPLNYRPLDWEETFRRAREIPFLELGVQSRADWVANGLLFFPLGLLGAASLGWTGGTGRRTCGCIIAAAGGCLLAMALEVTQLWFPGRTVSQNDVLAEILGSCAGGLAWGCFGPEFHRWIGVTWRSREWELWTRLTAAYTWALLIYAGMPYDVLLNRREFGEKLDLGRVSWGDLGDMKAILMAMVLFVPVGIGLQLRHRSLTSIVLLTAAIAGSFELIQVFIFSRYAIFLHAIAAVIGTILGVFALRQTAWLNFVWQRRIPNILVATYFFLVIMLFSYPFDFLPPSQWLDRIQGMWRVPLSAQYVGPEFQTLTNLLNRLAVFGMGGVLLRLCGKTLQSPLGWLAIAAPVLAELLQVTVATKHPDLTDMIVGISGVLIGTKFSDLLPRVPISRFCP